MVLLTIYPDEIDRVEILRWWGLEVDSIGSGKVKFQSFACRKSGSPLTTLCNTIVNGFVSYCGFRLAGFGPTKAFAAIGPKSGDDGLEMHKCHLKVAAEALGLTIKMGTVDLHSHVPFLGRWFLYPLSDKQCSISDPARCLGKINASVNLSTTADHACYMHACGVLSTDQATPVISDYCRTAIRLLAKRGGFKDPTQDPATLLKLRAQDSDLYYRIIGGPYPQEGVDELGILHFVQKSMNDAGCYVTINELSQYVVDLAECESIGDWPRKFFRDPHKEPRYDCDVNGWPIRPQNSITPELKKNPDKIKDNAVKHSLGEGATRSVTTASRRRDFDATAGLVSKENRLHRKYASLTTSRTSKPQPTPKSSPPPRSLREAVIYKPPTNPPLQKEVSARAEKKIVTQPHSRPPSKPPGLSHPPTRGSPNI